MKQKRVCSFLLAMCMLMSMILPAGAAGAPTVTLTGGSSVAADGTVTLTANISGNSGLSIYQLYFYYDTDVFEVKSLKASGNFGEEGSMLTNSIAVAAGKGRYDGQAGKDGILGLWYCATGEEIDANGEMAILKLKLKDGAADGNYTIGLDYSKANTINEEGVKVVLKTTGTTVKVGNGGTQKPADPKPVTPEQGEDEVIFTDIAGNWAEDYILEAGKRGLVNGKSAGIFDPNANMTRAEFMTILWRAVGSPAPKGKASFRDLPMAWYQEPIAWAEENQITNGTSPTTFDPNGNVTREQMMTILHRMVGKPIGMETIFAGVYDHQLQDSASVSSWAKDAIYWSIFQEILCGEQSVELGSRIAPQAAATRSQIAVSIIRYLDKD